MHGPGSLMAQEAVAVVLAPWPVCCTNYITPAGHNTASPGETKLWSDQAPSGAYA